MREIRKPNFIKNKRLVKTATFAIALFIATSLLISSIGFAATIGLRQETTNNKGIENVGPKYIASTSRAIITSELNSRSSTPSNPEPAPLGVPILTEGFEGSWLPPGWTQVITNTGAGPGSIPPTWSQTSYSVHSGSKAAGLWWDYNHQDEWLITPQITLTGSTTGNYYVTFWTYGWEGSIYDDHYYVKISTNNGTTWTPIFDLSNLTGNGWNQWQYPYTIQLNAYAGQTVKLAWHAIDCNDPGNPNYPGLWYIWIIDDIEIGYYDVPDNDVGVTSIDAPDSGTVYSPMTPKATVKNFGALNQTNVPVNFKAVAHGTPVTLVSDGFETYTPGAFIFPPGWTIETTNPTGTWHMYASTLTFSATTYPRVQEAGSNMAAQDESLISPTINCAGLSWVNVQFTKYFYTSPTADATFILYGSIDNGATWPFTLLTYTATSTTAELINITTWAAGQSQVKFKFRFISDADTSLLSYLYFDNFWVGQYWLWGPKGDIPPVGWEIVNYPSNPTTWNDNYWHRHTSTYTSYDSMYFPARIWYTTPYETVNCALITPSINCAALSTVKVYLNGYFYYLSTYPGRGYIEVSNDGGSTWYTAKSYTNASWMFYEFPDYNDIDITTWAAGQSSVKIRFRYEHTAAEQGRYWYISNVRVGDGSGNFIFYDSFQGVQRYSTNFKLWQPDNWHTWIPTIVSGAYNWENVVSGTSPTCTPQSGARMACYRSFSASTGSQAFLRSIPYDVSSANGLKMKFWMFHDTGYPTNADKIDVMVSTNGITWTNLGTYYRSCTLQGVPAVNAWREWIIDLTGYEDETALRIGFLATSTYGNNMFIDSVTLYDPGFITEYLKTVNISINANQVIQVAFPTWTPDAWQTQQNITITYDLFATTSLPGDQDPSNDQKTKTIDLYFPFFYDVKVVEILSPTSDGDAKPLPVKATIKNEGQYRVRNFFVQALIGSSIARSVQEDFSTAVVPNMPAGWYTNNPKWTTSNTANAGGVAPEARFYFSPSETGQFRMYCDPFNTVGQTVITLTFRHFVDHYATPYTLCVETSTDGGQTWLANRPWSISPTGNVGPELVTVVLTTAHGVGSPTFCISFTFDGYSFNIDYWYVDNIVCGTLPPIVDAEYDESVGIVTWLNPGETRQLEWPTWTPANLIYPQNSGKIKYTIKVESQYPGDQVPANNISSKTFKLNFWHDVLIKSVTQPVFRDRDIIKYHNGYANNAIGLTSPGTWEGAMRLTPTELGPYNGWQLHQVNFYHYAAYVPTHSGNIKIYGSGTATQPGALITSQAYSVTGDGLKTITLSNPVTIDASGDLWVSVEIVQTTAPDYPFGIDAGPAVRGKGDWVCLGGAWSELYTYGLDYNWVLEAVVDPAGPGPGGIDVYIKPGTKPIEAIVRNAGTFTETDLTCYADLYDPNLVLVYEYDYTGINLDPLGGEKTLSLGSYNFNLEGIYGLYLDLPLEKDDKPANNQKYYGIGVDNTPPTSTHALTPGSPDGMNGWYVSNVKVKLNATDPKVNDVSSGVKEIRYKLDGGAEQVYTAEFTVSTDGPHTVEYWAIDKVGNVETRKTATFKIDKTKPEVLLEYEVTGGNQWIGWELTFRVTATDATSGMDRVEFFYNNVSQAIITGPGPTYEWVLKNYNPAIKVSIKATGYDLAGNFASDVKDNPEPHSNEQSIPNNNAKQPSTTVKINLGR